MAGIQLSGLTSGMDTDTIITQLLAIESQPLTRMTNDKTVANTRAQAFKDIEARLKNLQTSAQDLKSVLTWNPVQSVTSSQTDKFTATVTGGVAPGPHSVRITQMARSSQDTYAWTPQGSDSSLTINGVTVTVPANANIDDVTSMVNGNSSLGVYAVNAGGKLVLTSRATGADSSVAVSGTAMGAGLSAADPLKARAGLNAQGELDGVAFDQASNTISYNNPGGTPPVPSTSAAAIPGLSITLKGVTTTDGNLEVGVPTVDRAAVQAKLKAFVDNYNDTLALISGKVNEKKQTGTDGAGNATTTAIDYTKGVLFGDSGLRSVLSSMRQMVANPVTGSGLPASMSMLSQLGVSTGAANSTVNADSVSGKLTFDVDAFNKAMDSDPSSVQKLLGGVNGVPGFGQSFDALLTPLTQAAGVLDQRVETAEGQVSDINDQMARLTDRLTARREALTKQFTAMEQAMSANQSQLSQLLNALGTSSS